MGRERRGVGGWGGGGGGREYKYLVVKIQVA